MPKRPRRPAPSELEPLRFELYADEQRDALRILLSEGFGDLLRRDVPIWYTAKGRGLVIMLFTGETVGSVQPPVFVPLALWQAEPLLLNTPHTDLLDAIETYNPAREYILLTAGQKTETLGQYAWWRMPLVEKPGIAYSAAQRPTKN